MFLPKNLWLLLILLPVACVPSGYSKVAPHNDSLPPSHQPLISHQRVMLSARLSVNAMNVLTAAFETDFKPGDDRANAYDFAAYQGHKGMDWWNFPWDLESSQMQYVISYDDMKDLLTHVKVRKDRQSPIFISYAEMLKNMVDQLTPEIMNAHGGYLRVVKIIYCLRNFLTVALKYQLSEDLPYLKSAALKLIALDKTNKLVTGTSPYLKASQYKPKNIHGLAEDRTAKNGISELDLLSK